MGLHKWLVRGVTLLLGVAVLLLPGCRSQTSSRAPTALSAATDPCAERMHEIGGELLLFYATYHRLPDRLDELRSMPGSDPSLELSCPISHEAYVYLPTRLSWLKTQQGPVVLYDSRPVHEGMRWALIWQDTGSDDPQIMRVVAVPDAAVRLVPTSRP
jgi:hypothetical protein